MSNSSSLRGPGWVAQPRVFITLALADVDSLVGADKISNVVQPGIVPFRGGVNEIIDRLQHSDFAKEIYFGHRKCGFHRPPGMWTQ